MRLITKTLLAAALAATGAAPALAADTTSFNVTITILDTCDVDAAAATDVAFGSVESTQTNIDNAGSLSVQCTPLTPYTIALDNGENGTDVATRAMANGAIQVPYQLYQDAARGPGDVWGNTAGTDVYSGTGDGAIQVIPVYGRVPDANFPAGAYSDVVMATIVY